MHVRILEACETTFTLYYLSVLQQTTLFDYIYIELRDGTLLYT